VVICFGTRNTVPKPCTEEKQEEQNEDEEEKKNKKMMMMMMIMKNYMLDGKRYFTRIVGTKRRNISTGRGAQVLSGQSRHNRKA
jgi:hypothetical protein